MNKKLAVVAAVVVACCALVVEAKTDRIGDIKERTQAKELVGADGKVFRYRLAEKLPEDGSRVPLVLFLHGAGERGTNNVAQLVHGVGELVRWMDAREKGFRLIAGQVPNGKRWVEVDWNAKSHSMPAEPSETMALLMELLDKQLAVESRLEGYVQPCRVSHTQAVGHSS